MPERTSYAHGTPSWTDLSTTDTDKAKTFYNGLFGWEFEDNPGAAEDRPYIMAFKNGKAVAGLSRQAPEQAEMGIPPMWNTYITTSDVDATLAKVESAGGTIMMPSMDVMEAGKMAVVVDPTGAVSCLWQAMQHIGSEVVNEHGSLCWNECMTPDVPAAAAFYHELFGWGTEEMDMGDQGTYTVFMLGEDGVAGAMNPPMDGIPPHWGTVFAVDDTDACVAAGSEAGGTVMAGPFDTPVGRSAHLADPQGAGFQIIQLNDPAT